MTSSPRLVAAIAFIATFIAGAASMHAFEAFRPKGQANDSWTTAATRLQLSDTQRHLVDSIFAKYQPSSDQAMMSLIPRVTAISDSIQHDIDAVLTPAQRASLGKLRRPPTFMLKRKGFDGGRVDTIQIRR